MHISCNLEILFGLFISMFTNNQQQWHFELHIIFAIKITYFHRYSQLKMMMIYFMTHTIDHPFFELIVFQWNLYFNHYTCHW
jgi:hypothetical protein